MESPRTRGDHDTTTAPAPAEAWSPGCPVWCQTSEHGSGELGHFHYREVARSLRSPKHATVEVAFAGVGIGLEQQRHRQDQAMTVALIEPPGAAEPCREVSGHSDCDDIRPLTSRLSLAGRAGPHACAQIAAPRRSRETRRSRR